MSVIRIWILPNTTPLGLIFPLTLALPLLAAACARDAPAGNSDLTTTIDTIDGVIRVTNTGTPPEWQLTQVVSIGPKTLAVGDGGPEEFGRVSSASLGPDDEVFVADIQYDEIRVFGLDGIHRRTFGRSGEGPGEFSGLYSVAWTGDRLLTLDPHLGRVGELQPTASSLASDKRKVASRAPAFAFFRWVRTRRTVLVQRVSKPCSWATTALERRATRCVGCEDLLAPPR